jgi:hypothetical protein
MDLGRLRAADVAVGASAAGLVAALAAGRGPSVTDGLLGALTVPALALPALQVTRRSPALPVAAGTLATAAGLVTAPVLGVRALRAREDRLPRIAAAAAAAALLVSGFAAMHDERVPGAVPPAVPVRPAPPATEA